MSAQVAADLRAAADVLERDGWTQEFFTDQAGCHCAAGAVRVVAYEKGDKACYRDAVEALAAYVTGTDNLIALYRWNDNPDRTSAEVIAAFRAAADKAEQA